MVGPWKLLRQSQCNRTGACRHAARKSLERHGVGVERRKTAGRASAAVRLARPQRSRERAPNPKELGVKVLQRSSDISRLGMIEVKAGLDRISVAPILMANEHTKRDERIQKIAGTACMNADSLLDRFKV